MARTIKEIANGMKAEFVGNENLRAAYAPELDDFNTNTNTDDDARAAYYDEHFSAVSVETCLIYIVATCAAALEHMMDWFKEDVDEIVANERYGHKGWYETKAREFHYTDQNTNEEVYPITQVSCEELNFGIRMKVAKGNPGSLGPLGTSERTAFEYWMNRQKPAGIPITYISTSADKLRLRMVVFYDPVKMDAAHVSEAINTAITAHLQSIDFNGVFTTMALVDDLQKLDWVDLAEIHEVHVQPYGYQYEIQVEENARNVPVSGWYELDLESTDTQIIARPNL